MSHHFAGPMFGAAILLYSASAISAEDKRQLDSHEHGHATLNLAVDANQLLVEFESPAANIVGFEHEPKDSAQEEALKNAVVMLESSEKVFTLPASANCTLQSVEVEAPHSDHDEHHDEKKHDEKSHDEKGHDEENHSEFHAMWAFTCDDISELKAVDVNLIKLFPNTEEIDANVIGPNGQSSTELTPAVSQITL